VVRNGALPWRKAFSSFSSARPELPSSLPMFFSE